MAEVIANIKEGIAEKAKESAVDQLEKEMADAAPWYLKCCFPCFGVVGTLKACFCFVPKAVKEKADPILEKLDKAEANTA